VLAAVKNAVVATLAMDDPVPVEDDPPPPEVDPLPAEDEVLVPDDCDDSSSANLAWAEVRVDWADDTFWASVVVSSEARFCPTVTCCPTATFTADTVPAT
jgi:hypothetical protein